MVVFDTQLKYGGLVAVFFIISPLSLSFFPALLIELNRVQSKNRGIAHLKHVKRIFTKYCYSKYVRLQVSAFYLKMKTVKFAHQQSNEIVIECIRK